MEEETWKVPETTAKLDADALQATKDVYLQKMKPVVSEDQLAGLRQRYRLRRKE